MAVLYAPKDNFCTDTIRAKRNQPQFRIAQSYGIVGVNHSLIQRQVVGVVDDEPGVLTGLKRILNASGLRVELFLSAEDLLARGSFGDFTCLIIDINLGGMSGIELRRRLAAVGSDAPVIFITARHDEATRREAMAAGCAAYLGKPFPGHVLIDAIASAIDASRPQH